MKFIALIFALFTFTFSFSQTWQSVGSGTNNSSHGMLTWNGKLIDLGSFNSPCNRVAEWDGVSWNCLAGGVGIVARAGVVWQGKLVVVGDFWNVQQPCVGCNGVAVWDGVSWAPLGNGVNNDVLSVTVWNNELVIAGDFTQADGVPVARIVKWNGTIWESVGPIGVFDNDIRAMVEFEGDLWVGGDFNNVGGCSPCDGLVKYDPTTSSWVGGNSGVDLIGGVNESVRVLYLNPNDGNLYMGGEFPELWDGDAAAQDFNMGGVAMYDGSNWTPLGTGLNEYCRAMHEYNGDLIVGGYFTNAGGTPANKIAKWNPTTSTWSAMGLGFDLIGIDEYVKSAAVWNGIFFAGGAYTQAEGNPMNYISQWYEAPTAPPVAWINSSSSVLCGSGCIDFLDNSTNAPTSWTWTFPGSSLPTSTDQNPGNVCWAAAGTYNVSLQACNAFGCNTINMDVEVANGATVTVNDASVCDGNPATLTAVPSIPGGSYLWSPGGETTPSIVVNPATTTVYSVEYNVNGCTSTIQNGTVTVNTTPTVALNTSSASICEGGSVALTATPSAGGGTYIWSPTGETTASVSASPATTGDYSVEYTLGGCTSNPEICSITVTPTPTVSVNDESICDGGSATLIAAPSAGGGTYLWSPGGETTSSITESPAATSSYSVVYTLNGCPSNSEMGTISVGTTPTVSVNNETICAGQSTTLIAAPSSGGGTYLWSPGGETTSSITESPATTTSYSVVYTLNGCPSNSEIGIISVNPAPSVSVNDESICDGGSATLIAAPSAGGGTYLWSPGGETTSSITESPASTTSYSVVYTLNGCPSNSEIGTISVNPTPTISVNNESICDGGSAVLIASPSAGGGTYLWSPGGETTSSITESPASTSSYSVVYTLNGCPSNSEMGTITVGTTPTISVTNQTICSGESATLIATPSTGGGSYLWSPGGETTSSITESPASTSSFSVIYTLNGCPSNSEIGTISVNPTPTISVNNESICTGESATLIATPSAGGGTYLWSPGGETTSSITESPASTSSYSVTYTLNGCPSTVEVGTITVNPTPSISVNSETICTGESTTIIATPSAGGGTYLWSPGGETTSSILVSPIANDSYTVIYTLNGCESLPMVSTVTVSTSPDVSTTEANNVITAVQTTALYQWLDCNDNNAEIPGETAQSYTPVNNGNYAVQIDLNGCIDTSACTTISTIGIDELSMNQIYVFPNPVTDILHIKSSSGLSTMHYQIMDVLGREIRKGSVSKESIIDVTEISEGSYSIIFNDGRNGIIQFVKL